MENIVPATLQRLRAADIMRLAGLMSASLGQEYCRVGAVHDTRRQGSHLSGRIDTSLASSEQIDMLEEERASNGARRQHYTVEVEIISPTSWTSSCQCSPQPARLLCPHAAALLYQWLARPTAFAPVASLSIAVDTDAEADAIEPSVTSDRDGMAPTSSGSTGEISMASPALKPARLPGAGTLPRTTSAPAVSEDLHGILTQFGLSELRGIAREYEIVINGVSKLQLAELILDKLRQPEAVRRIATTLEKPQRQLLAAITLAGGSMADEDLRGLYERFALGQPAQLQGILLMLQSKALLFRTSFSNTQPRMNLSSALQDIGWYVPVEVRAALRVTMPATPFDVVQGTEKEAPPIQRPAEPYALLADLLLIAQALDGYYLGIGEIWVEEERPGESTPMRPASQLSHDGSVAIPSPADLPPSALLRTLREQVTGTPAFLRFVVSLLRLAGILYKDDSAGVERSCLRILPNAGQLLLGPGRVEVLDDLFELWLTQSSYGELYELQEHHVRLRCRSSSFNMPILRSGELDAENSEARQTIVALLAQAPSQQWISFSAFARFVYRLSPLFLQRRQRLYSAPHWWMEQEQGRPLRPLQSQDWARAEYHYLSYLIGGPLHWWGLCDIALSEDGRLLAFRLTAIAARLLAGGQGRLTGEVFKADDRVQANLSEGIDIEIVDTRELLLACSLSSWPIIEVLETFAEPAGVRSDRLRYRLTPKALGTALSRGQRPGPLLDILHVRADNAVARQRALFDEVIAQLERWIASYGRTRIYTGVTLLEVADSVVMREVSAITSLDEQMVLSITPTIHVVKKAAIERLTDELKRRGQAPLVHDEDGYGSE
jgi:hypothetical protein